MFCSYFFLPSNPSRSSTPSYPSNCKSFFKNAKTQHNNKSPKQRKPNQTKNSKCKQIKAQKKLWSLLYVGQLRLNMRSALQWLINHVSSSKCK